MNNIKVLRKKTTYTDSRGEVKDIYNFYLELENGQRICIKNTFPKDYGLLKVIAYDIVNEKK